MYLIISFLLFIVEFMLAKKQSILFVSDNIHLFTYPILVLLIYATAKDVTPWLFYVV